MNKNEVSEIRKKLHSVPESAHNEKMTSELVLSLLKQFNPDKIFSNIGGFGIVARFTGKRPGRSKMFRCELDAVPGPGGPQHLCGHDGHMTILIALASRLSQRDFPGIAYLLFQPAEENGEGAALMVKDIKKLNISFDDSFALHNNPNYPSNSIVIHRGTYAPASVGVEFIFKGKDSHAAYPEKAKSPLKVIMELTELLNELNNQELPASEFKLGTVVNIVLGEKNFGVTPGYGELRLTLRANQDLNLEDFQNKITERANNLSIKYGIELGVNLHDYFPATVNDPELTQILESVANEHSLKIIYPETPTRGSDDFSHFSQISRTLFFDIGNGPGADIHQPDYQFNEEIILPAVELLYAIITNSKYNPQ
jgi:amidohydrolase